MTDSSDSKICVICGEDCSHRPRTKDRRGRYYCKACYEAAKQKKAQQRPSSPAADSSQDHHNQLGTLELERDESEEEATGIRCPSCGRAMAGDAVLCTNCGYSTQTQQQVVGTGAKAGGGATDGSTWPLVIGIFSIIFGGGGIIFYGYNIASAIMANGGGAFKLGEISAAGVLVLLATWLFIAGIGICRRRKLGARALWWWASVKTILLTIYMALAVILVLTVSDFSEQAPPQYEDLNLGKWIILAFFAVSYVYQLIWPVFILLWLRRSKIKSQTEKWQ